MSVQTVNSEITFLMEFSKEFGEVFPFPFPDRRRDCISASGFPVFLEPSRCPFSCRPWWLDNTKQPDIYC